MFLTSIINIRNELHTFAIPIPLSHERRSLIVSEALNEETICGGQVRAIQTRRVSTITGTVQLHFAVTKVVGSGGLSQLGFVPLTGEETVRARLLLMNISNNTLI